MSEYVAILTGDVIASQSASPDRWLPALKAELSRFGDQSGDWDIVRGDQFQLKRPPQDALLSSLILRAGVLNRSNVHLRISIGLGEVDHPEERISESNGSAFVRSGAGLESKGHWRICVRSEDKAFDKSMQLMLDLAEEVIGRWTPVSAEVIQAALLHPEWRQFDLAENLDRSQSTISETLKRTGLDLLLRLDDHYRNEIQNRIRV